MNLKTLSLSELNAQSETKSFSLDKLVLQKPAQDRLWAPSELPPLVHLPEIDLMSSDEQRRYNQLYALGVLEQFIWLENRILCRVIEKVLKDKTLSSELRTGLTYFYDEELKHSEMFWRLLQIAEPSMYPTRDYYFLNATSLSIKAVESLIEAPKMFLVWVWMTIFFEERTLDFSKRYILFQHANPEALDQNFLLVHKLHMQDELRHFMMDVHLLNKYYDGASGFKKHLASRMFKTILSRLSNPRLMTIAYLKQLSKEFDSFGLRAKRGLLNARENLRTNKDFKKISMSARSTPRTYALLQRYDETRSLQSLFVDV